MNLVMTVGDLDNSILVKMSGESIGNDSWALRGQIGDILSGHFSALAFLAVALSIIFQSEANKQMRESINKQDESIKQQSEALKVQSESLAAQIEELQASRKESSKQTEEFYIQNMNVKLDRYYKLLNENLDKLANDTVINYNEAKKIIQDILYSENIDSIEDFLSSHEVNNQHQVVVFETQQRIVIYQTQIHNVIQTLNHIYNDLELLNKGFPSAYHIFIRELGLRLFSDKRYWDIYKDYDDAKLCLAFQLFIIKKLIPSNYFYK